MFLGASYFLFQGQRGGVEHKKAWGWNIPAFLELFCFQGVASTIRLP